MTAPTRDRGLGRGVSQLIPQPPGSPAQQASATLAALATVQIPVGALQAAVVLLDATACRSEDEQLRAAAEATVAHLREAIGPAGPAPAAADSASAWFAAPLTQSTEPE
ncbi:hypothetical protein [Streptomyces sp. NPDC089919]|uniref:hypothetical protein n=1 Tax=Streptomyces sp. NPDC089919 TaxID=3155188 RepID=UPI00341C664B